MVSILRMRRYLSDPDRLPFDAVWWGITGAVFAGAGAILLLDGYWLAALFLLPAVVAGRGAYTLWNVGRRW